MDLDISDVNHALFIALFITISDITNLILT